jgi:hypothetical protein
MRSEPVSRIKVNFGDVEGFDALPEGVYTATVEKIEYRPAKEAGKSPYLNVEYTVSEPEEFAGRKVWEVLSWAPKALFRMRDFFRAAGFEDDEYDLDVDEESGLLLDPDLAGEAVEVTIENEIYNKKEVNRVVAVEFLNPSGPEEDEEEEEETDEEGDGEDDEEEAPAKKAPAKPAAKTFRPTTTGAKKPPAKRTFR